MKALDLIATLLIVVGALNWGLVAVAEFDLVAFVAGESFGETNLFSRLVYGLVGLAAIYEVAAIQGIRRRWHERPATA